VVKFESLDPEIRGVLDKKVSELGLRVEGSPVEKYVQQLYHELERRGFRKFRPVCYLTDEWGCPDQQPVLGIPFYLADPKLRKLESAVDNLEDERQIMSSTTPIGSTPPPSGAASLDRSSARIATTTGRCRSARTSCATSRAGTPRSIPTRTSPRRLLSG
jgi:hypothetical protein